MHWALLYTIGALFVSTFILFETGGSFSNEGRHILFTVLCCLMSFVLCVSRPLPPPAFAELSCPQVPDSLSLLQALRDLADPVEGVYNATALLETRLAYLNSVLEKHRKLPGRLGNPSPAYLYSNPEVVVDQPPAGSRQRPFSDDNGSAALPVSEHLSQLATSAVDWVAQTVPLLSGEGMPKPFEIPRAESSEQADTPAETALPASRNASTPAKEGATSNGSQQNGHSTIRAESSRSGGVSTGSTDLFARPQRFSEGQSQPQTKANFTPQPSWAWDRPKASYQGQPSFDDVLDTYDGFEL